VCEGGSAHAGLTSKSPGFRDSANTRYRLHPGYGTNPAAVSSTRLKHDVGAVRPQRIGRRIAGAAQRLDLVIRDAAESEPVRDAVHVAPKPRKAVGGVPSRSKMMRGIGAGGLLRLDDASRCTGVVSRFKRTMRLFVETGRRRMAKPAKRLSGGGLMTPVPIKSILPINVGLSPAQEATMISILDRRAFR